MTWATTPRCVIAVGALKAPPFVAGPQPRSAGGGVALCTSPVCGGSLHVAGTSRPCCLTILESGGCCAALCRTRGGKPAYYHGRRQRPLTTGSRIDLRRIAPTHGLHWGVREDACNPRLRTRVWYVVGMEREGARAQVCGFFLGGVAHTCSGQCRSPPPSQCPWLAWWPQGRRGKHCGQRLRPSPGRKG